MTPRQKELLEEVYEALRDPINSPYFGMSIEKAHRILMDKLDEIKKISDYEEEMKVI